MKVMEVDHITKDYGDKRGVFDVTFDVEEGEVLGFLGPNGAGKTTTIRQLMGFIHPDKGSVRIQGMDCFKKAAVIKKHLGYLPGEIAFIDEMTGTSFIRFMAKMNKITDRKREKELLDYFELDPKGKIKKMSKGMKQKIGIICAFMGNPDILILDEPTSGLDPLMQNKFIDLILEEKKRGATILMSSHDFEEVERTCDRVAIIRTGEIVAIEDVQKMQANKKKIFEIKLADAGEAVKLGDLYKGNVESIKDDTITLGITGDLNTFIKSLGNYQIVDIDMRKQTLEELFLHFYGGGKND